MKRECGSPEKRTRGNVVNLQCVHEPEKGRRHHNDPIGLFSCDGIFSCDDRLRQRFMPHANQLMRVVCL